MPNDKPQTTRFTVKYEDGHSHDEPWAKTVYFCMICGDKAVWFRDDGGDYYQGEQHMCTSCGSSWAMPSSPCPPSDWQDRQRLEALKHAE